jgi:hypothetical protein
MVYKYWDEQSLDRKQYLTTMNLLKAQNIYSIENLSLENKREFFDLEIELIDDYQLILHPIPL